MAVSIIVWFVLCAWIMRFQPLSHCMLSGIGTVSYGFRSGGSKNGFIASLFLLDLSSLFSLSFPSGHDFGFIYLLA